MIDMYRMKGQEAVDMIEQLRKEIRWTKFELLGMVREHCKGITGRMKNKRIHDRSLDELLAEVSAMDSEGHDIRKLFWELVEKAPFRIKLDNLDDREGCVMIEAESKILAVHDQSISGSNWEAPDDLNIAYAMPMDHPGLLEKLKKEGYEINDDEYSPPDGECPHGNELGSCSACDVAGDLAYDAAREDSRRNF